LCSPRTWQRLSATGGWKEKEITHPTQAIMVVVVEEE
jgi:hypothetical protein